MPLLFCLVSSGTTILAEHAICSGNFEEVIQTLLPNIPSGDHRHTYTHSDYKFHYISEDSIIYLCIGDNDTQQQAAFSFLEGIKSIFLGHYNTTSIQPLPYSLQADFSFVINNHMKHHNSGMNTSINNVNQQVDQLKDIMVHSIDQLMNRGERLELLVNKSQNLSENAMTFKSSSVMVRKKTCSKNFRMVIILIVISLIMLYAVMCAACGGLAWRSCVGKQGGNSSSI